MSSMNKPKSVLQPVGQTDDVDKFPTGTETTLSIATGSRGRPKTLTVDTLKSVVSEIVAQTTRATNIAFTVSINSFTSELKKFVKDQFASYQQYLNGKIEKIETKVELLKSSVVSTSEFQQTVKNIYDEITVLKDNANTDLNRVELDSDEMACTHLNRFQKDI